MRFYKVPLSNLLVAYDDLDIDTAALRLRKKGSHGGHNGMRSIMANLGGAQDFPRLRVGIGRPSGQKPVAEHVLTPFDKREARERPNPSTSTITNSHRSPFPVSSALDILYSLSELAHCTLADELIGRTT